MEHTASPSPAPALAKGIHLLEQLAVDGQASLEKLASKNGWPKSSTLRYLQTLEQIGAVHQHPESRHWHALKELRSVMPRADGIFEQFSEALPLWAEATNHCAELYQMAGGRLRMIDRADPESSEILVRARIGDERDLNELDATAAITFAYAPHLEPPEIMWVWENGNQITLAKEVRDAQIQNAKEQGFSLDHDFNEHGIRRFAKPVLERERLVGVLAIAQRQTPRAELEKTIIRDLVLQNSHTPRTTPVHESTLYRH